MLSRLPPTCWLVRDPLRAELATSALMRATQRQQPSAGLIQHCNRGVEGACGDYQTRDKAKRDLFAYVEGVYNRQQLHPASVA